MNSLNKNLDPNCTILVVDDELSSLDSFEFVLRSFGLEKIILCNNGKQALEVLQQKPIDAILLDLVMPGISGEDLLNWISSHFPHLPVIVVTGIDTVESAVNCIKAGAFDYLVKPVEESPLRLCLSRVLELSALRRENNKLKSYFLREDLDKPEAFSDFITQTPQVFKVFRYLEAVAPSGQPILITGETGVGKELVAKAIHKLIDGNAPFAAVNLSGLDDHLFSDTLFGHRKGAFTGAQNNRKGLIEQAGNGVLFLDEIGDLPELGQVKLLRVLQEREYMPLGSDVAKPVEAKIVTATHQNLEELKEKGKFREDLYYRLCSHHVHIPPLRKRLMDIPNLTEYFIKQAAQSLNMATPFLKPETIEVFQSYNWPGNIRELKALIHDAMGRSGAGQAPLDTLLAKIHSQKHSGKEKNRFTARAAQNVLLPDPLPTLEEMSTLLVKEAMKRSQGKQVKAARMLGISQPALCKRLKKIPKQN